MRFYSFIRYMPYYLFFNKKKGSEQGLFFMNVLDYKVFERINKVYENNTYKSLMRMSALKVAVEQKIYIHMPHSDLLTVGSNLVNKNLPEMVSSDLDLPFQVNIKEYDPNEYIKMRIVLPEDWETINWKKGKLKDLDAE